MLERSFEATNKAFLEKFAKQEEHRVTLREGTDAVVVQENPLSSMESLDRKNSQAASNDEARSGFLLVAVMEVLPVATFGT